MIHKSLFLGEAGSFYPDFDCQDGDRARQKAFGEHDANLDTYCERSKRVLDSVSIDNEYADALAALHRDALRVILDRH
ncbi:hypothetical protein BLA6863_04704 [Burkholderia lata]|uniref:Uncharacterized protein n=1 Tax=Burkholderia lata (strain ATCC 17760 / DSM 23089 / LMG 22485 / NCIMB 9086 / R18194 / 383) TaxID=482957 RepID=A0A6P2NTR8_BURL3|nr:hypothetical protein BLA6863_04704 [Burkholderia lata]